MSQVTLQELADGLGMTVDELISHANKPKQADPVELDHHLWLEGSGPSVQHAVDVEKDDPHGRFSVSWKSAYLVTPGQERVEQGHP